MKLKRTLLWARLRSFRTYVQLTLKRMTFYLPLLDPMPILYLHTEVIYPSDLTEEEVSFFFKRQRRNHFIKSLGCLYTEYTGRVPGDPLWTVEILFVFHTPFCRVQYYLAEECKDEDFWALSLPGAPKR